MAELRLGDRFSHAWNAFKSRSPTDGRHGTDTWVSQWVGSGSRMDRTQYRVTTEKAQVTAVFNRIAIDVSELLIEHVRIDENKRYVETIHSGLNDCLTYEANIDQTGKEFIRDLIMSLFDEGTVAAVPIDTSVDPKTNETFDIKTMRVGKITDWQPRAVRVDVYNDRTGMHEELWFPKRSVAIIDNPLYQVMNAPNSTLKRLVRKLNQLDVVDEQSSSGKLDIIIQLPYVIKSPQKMEQAEQRRKQIEDQLSGSRYGIAYTDGAERITQLNRPSENNLMAQVQYLKGELFNQLGVSQTIFDGTADEATKLNYLNNTVMPIISAVIDEMKRKFITRTARTQGQTIMVFRDAFKLVPLESLANLANAFIRNEIMSANEFRSVLGQKPSSDPKSDELRNPNVKTPNGQNGTQTQEIVQAPQKEEIKNG